MHSPGAAPALFPRIEFPEDPGLPGLGRLFEQEYLWRELRRRSANEALEPRRFRLRHFIHSPGRSAMVCYEVEWPPDQYLPPEHFVLRLQRGKPLERFLYPADPRLPGLAAAASPGSALRLVNQHVLAIPARHARVELVRYRPAFRAVLRHKAGKIRLYARVMRPAALPPLLAALDIVRQSAFTVPGLAGYWDSGAVVWLTEVRGSNLRRLIRSGRRPDPAILLDGLASLWRSSRPASQGRPFDLARACRRARRSFRHHARDFAAARRNLEEAVSALEPFVRAWRPLGMAHNDFYDDQLLLLPDGRVALVDFEEAGPGDPLLDVGNFLAHLRWASRFGKPRALDSPH